MSAAERQRDAFITVLERDPSAAPGPTALNKELGHGSRNKIWWSKHRAELMKEFGFKKEMRGHVERWVRQHEQAAGYVCWCGEVHVDRQFWKAMSS